MPILTKVQRRREAGAGLRSIPIFRPPGSRGRLSFAHEIPVEENSVSELVENLARAIRNRTTFPPMPENLSLNDAYAMQAELVRGGGGRCHRGLQGGAHGARRSSAIRYRPSAYGRAVQLGSHAIGGVLLKRSRGHARVRDRGCDRCRRDCPDSGSRHRGPARCVGQPGGRHWNQHGRLQHRWPTGSLPANRERYATTMTTLRSPLHGTARP